MRRLWQDLIVPALGVFGRLRRFANARGQGDGSYPAKERPERTRECVLFFFVQRAFGGGGRWRGVLFAFAVSDLVLRWMRHSFRGLGNLVCLYCAQESGVIRLVYSGGAGPS